MFELIETRMPSFSGAGSISISTVRWKMNRPRLAILFLIGSGSGFSGRVAEVDRMVQSLRL
jgi:hypothetical protein